MTAALPPFTRRVSRRNPALFIVLLDQSRSMSEQVVGMGLTKADFAATAVNDLIYGMIDQTATDPTTGDIKKSVYLTILGYSDEVESLLKKNKDDPKPTDDPIDLPTLARQSLGNTTVLREVYDSATNTYHQVQDQRPYWITAKYINGTHMDKAFLRARDITRKWIQSPPEHGQDPRYLGLPPIIIHITDGEHTGHYPPEPITQEIRSEGTQQGPNLIFNCHFSGEMSDPCIFPSHPSELERFHDPFAPRMFDMSSVIPDRWRENASYVTQQPLATDARGFIYNGSSQLLVKFINWGTMSSDGYDR